jgi:hypothetical protein
MCVVHRNRLPRRSRWALDHSPVAVVASQVFLGLNAAFVARVVGPLQQGIAHAEYRHERGGGADAIHEGAHGNPG